MTLCRRSCCTRPNLCFVQPLTQPEDLQTGGPGSGPRTATVGNATSSRSKKRLKQRRLTHQNMSMSGGASSTFSRQQRPGRLTFGGRRIDRRRFRLALFAWTRRETTRTEDRVKASKRRRPKLHVCPRPSDSDLLVRPEKFDV